MKNPQGTIVEIVRDAGGVRAVVEVETAAVCARCASGRGCGAGLMSGRSGKRRIEVSIAPGLELADGDGVGIELAPGNVLRAALLVYGLPLAGAICGAALAFLNALGDGAAAALAIAGLFAGALVSRHRLASASCLARFTPAVSRRIVSEP